VQVSSLSESWYASGFDGARRLVAAVAAPVRVVAAHRRPPVRRRPVPRPARRIPVAWDLFRTRVE
jgi:hypothetical protein